MTDEIDVGVYHEMTTKKCVNLPINKFLGLKLTSQGSGYATAEYVVGPSHENTSGAQHGGIVYSLLDTVAFLASIKLLQPGEMALTHDIYVSVLRPVSLGSKVTLSGKVLQNGKSVIFTESEAHVGGKLVACAKISKTRTRMSKL
eukprot:Phypoly_transcript_23794.p1 GENE.Phypoly_transcript_23794~~Phypoly_transcript_23794.p1  ORF type:complete len:145 (-),score=10.13 Phypoly_transcript_23794:39-473(-)